MKCVQCNEVTAIAHEKYCRQCRRVVMSEMEKSGYLASKVNNHCGQSRTAEMREVTSETKRGTRDGG